MSKPSWEFDEHPPKAPNNDPIQGEYFKQEALENAAEALVRESYQNTMDAKLEEDVARIRVHFSGKSDAIETKDYKQFLSGLGTHIKAEGNGLTDVPDDKEPMDILVIEDFGTSGLIGDVTITTDPPAKEKKYHDFYYFWRNIARSGKSDSDAGRWGVGKTVFAASSRINSFYGLTRRKDDSQTLLMGQSTMKTRFIDGKRFQPYGYFGVQSKSQPTFPVDAVDYIGKFVELFGLSRDGENGLSVVIPFPFSEITPEEMLRAVLRNYSFPILQGALEVEFDVAGKVTLLNQNTMLDEIDKIELAGGDEERERLRRMCELAAWSITLPERDHCMLKAAGSGGYAPKWSRELFSEEDLDLLRERFHSDEAVGLCVPLQVYERDGAIHDTFFKVYLQREDADRRGWSQYIRRGITISGMTGLSRRRGVLGFVLIEDEFLRSFLGATENPAHTFWSHKDDSLNKYRRGPSVVWFVRDSLMKVVDILSDMGNVEQPDLLKDVFSIALPSSPEKKTPGQGKRGRKPGDKKLKIVSTPQPIQMTKIADGFQIRPNPDCKKKASSLTIYAAYEIRRGNPFKKYNPLDFELSKGPISIKSEGVRIVSVETNGLRCEILRDDYRIEISGFDPTRDLRVKTDYKIED